MTSAGASAPLSVATLRILSPSGATIHCDRFGSGPPLVLVHGSFSDHVSNWQHVAPLLAPHFTVHAVARRGRGSTDATENHTLADEATDVAAVVHSISEPVFLLGHSYGAQVALAAALETRDLVRKLVLYEPPRPGSGRELLPRLEQLAAEQDWDGLAYTFFHEGLAIPEDEMAGLRESEFWPLIVADAEASLGDLRALSGHAIDEGRLGELRFPVVLQIGSESPREFFFTDALAARLPDVRIETLEGQAHEGMTTNPEQYAAAVRRIFLG